MVVRTLLSGSGSFKSGGIPASMIREHRTLCQHSSNRKITSDGSKYLGKHAVEGVSRMSHHGPANEQPVPLALAANVDARPRWVLSLHATPGREPRRKWGAAADQHSKR